MSSDARAGSAEGVTESDGSSARVQDIRVQIELSLAGNRLGSERFVDLDEINIIQLQIRFGQDFADSWSRANAHDSGFDASDAVTNLKQLVSYLMQSKYRN